MHGGVMGPLVYLDRPPAGSRHPGGVLRTAAHPARRPAPAGAEPGDREEDEDPARRLVAIWAPRPMHAVRLLHRGDLWACVHRLPHRHLAHYRDEPHLRDDGGPADLQGEVRLCEYPRRVHHPGRPVDGDLHQLLRRTALLARNPDSVYRSGGRGQPDCVHEGSFRALFGFGDSDVPVPARLSVFPADVSDERYFEFRAGVVS